MPTSPGGDPLMESRGVKSFSGMSSLGVVAGFYSQTARVPQLCLCGTIFLLLLVFPSM